MLVARVAHESLCPALDRPTRLFMLNWALQVLTSWALPLNTFRGVVTSLLPLIMACLRKEITKLNRIGEKYIEYTFGVYRTLTNTDQLTVNNMLEIVERQEVFQDILFKNGWLMPSKTTSYTAAGQALLDMRKMPQEEISDERALNIANEAALRSEAFLRILGWSKETLSPFIRHYRCMEDLVDVFEKVCPKSDCPAPEPENKSAAEKYATSRKTITRYH